MLTSYKKENVSPLELVDLNFKIIIVHMLRKINKVKNFYHWTRKQKYKYGNYRSEKNVKFEIKNTAMNRLNTVKKKISELENVSRDVWAESRESKI